MIAAPLYLAIALTVISRMSHPPIALLPVAIFGPIVTPFVVGALAHRRRYVFSEATDNLTIQSTVCFIAVGQPRIVPLSDFTALDFGSSLGLEGEPVGWIRVTTMDGRIFEFTGQPAFLGPDVMRIFAIVNKARASAGLSQLPTIRCHPLPAPRPFLGWLRCAGR
ncbi:MAG: hypothetical protein K2Y37_07105 [Pirellulales bacterium]|nr:hypothetical protein [Pirellulales bacterium]